MEYASSLVLILVEPSQERKDKGGRTCNEELAQDVDREDHDDAVEVNCARRRPSQSQFDMMSLHQVVYAIIQRQHSFWRYQATSTYNHTTQATQRNAQRKMLIVTSATKVSTK